VGAADRELQGFRIHALELPGFGLSDPLPLSSKTLRTQAVQFLDATLAELGLESAAIVANSMGALWAIWLALDRRRRVSSLTRIGCPALILGTAAPAPMRLMSARPLGRLVLALQRPSPGRVERMLASVGVDLSGDPELRDLVVAMQLRPSFAPAWLDLLHAAIRVRGARPSAAIGAAELARLTQPVLLIWGERDPFGAVAVGEQVVKIVANAELHVLPGGHAPWLSSRDETARLVIEFLERQFRPPAAGRGPIVRVEWPA